MAFIPAERRSKPNFAPKISWHCFTEKLKHSKSLSWIRYSFINSHTQVNISKHVQLHKDLTISVAPCDKAHFWKIYYSFKRFFLQIADLFERYFQDITNWQYFPGNPKGLTKNTLQELYHTMYRILKWKTLKNIVWSYDTYENSSRNKHLLTKRVTSMGKELNCYHYSSYHYFLIFWCFSHFHVFFASVLSFVCMLWKFVHGLVSFD